MSTEYWGTFSIYDHTTAVYRRALVMFDRVVIPVPTAPFGRLTEPMIDALSADVDYLVAKGRCVRFDWDPAEFNEWVREQAGKSLANYLGRDPQADTRYQLQYQIEQNRLPNVANLPDDRVVLPVAGSVEELEANADERNVLHIVLGKLAVPSPDAPLDDICRLRDTEGFATSLRKMRVWQDDLVLELLRANTEREKEVILRRARARLDDWIATYSRLIRDAGLARDHATVTTVATVGGGLAAGPLGFGKVLEGIGRALGILVALRPSWRAVADDECSPAGVIYHSRSAL